MRFDEVLQWLVAGYKISRKVWNQSYLEYDRERQMIMHHGSDRVNFYIVSQADILANDWRVNLVVRFYEGELYASE